MPVPASSVLYYPWIDIENERWLRRACLFWDEISTIVPASVKRPYQNRCARELNDEGILVPVRVNSDMDEIRSLTEAAEDYLTSPASMALLAGDSRVRSRIYLDKLPHAVRDFVTLHPDKLPDVVASNLKEAIDDGGWVRVHPEFANFYMTLLATQLATRLGLGLVTSSNPAEQLAIAVRNGVPTAPARIAVGKHVGGRDFAAHGPRRLLPIDTANGMLVDLFMSTISIPNNVPLSKLLKFRRSHEDELATLRKEMCRLVAEIPPDQPVEALRRSALNQYKANVKPALKSLRNSLKAQGWSTTLSGFLKVSFFSVAPSAALLAIGISNPVALAAGAGVSLAAVAASFAADRRKALSDSPYAYLLSLDQKWG